MILLLLNAIATNHMIIHILIVLFISFASIFSRSPSHIVTVSLIMKSQRASQKFAKTMNSTDSNDLATVKSVCPSGSQFNSIQDNC